MTEDMQIKLVETGNLFWDELGKLAARCLAPFPPELRPEVLAYLQDKCSVYCTDYWTHLDQIRRRRTGPSSQCYHVTWEIDVEAGDPAEAAMKARDYQLPPTTAVVFDVYDADGNCQRVDLLGDNGG